MPRKLRKLWKVTSGDLPGIADVTARPESENKAFGIYVQAHARVGYRWSEVWVDERDGRGWQLFEIINHAEESRD